MAGLYRRRTSGSAASCSSHVAVAVAFRRRANSGRWLSGISAVPGVKELPRTKPQSLKLRQELRLIGRQDACCKHGTNVVVEAVNPIGVILPTFNSKAAPVVAADPSLTSSLYVKGNGDGSDADKRSPCGIGGRSAAVIAQRWHDYRLQPDKRKHLSSGVVEPIPRLVKAQAVRIQLHPVDVTAVPDSIPGFIDQTEADTIIDHLKQLNGDVAVHLAGQFRHQRFEHAIQLIAVQDPLHHGALMNPVVVEEVYIRMVVPGRCEELPVVVAPDMVGSIAGLMRNGNQLGHRHGINLTPTLRPSWKAEVTFRTGTAIGILICRMGRAAASRIATGGAQSTANLAMD